MSMSHGVTAPYANYFSPSKDQTPAPEAVGRGYNRAPRGAQGAFYGPPLRLWLEPALVWVLADNLDIDVVFGALLDDGSLVPAVHPRLDDTRMTGGKLIHQSPATCGVLDARGGHQNHQKQA
jgi:hypothetical protein